MRMGDLALQVQHRLGYRFEIFIFLSPSPFKALWLTSFRRNGHRLTEDTTMSS